MPSSRVFRTAVQQRKRRVLGELDINQDLNVPHRPTKRRAPIAFGQENEDAVVEGIRSGIYDFDEVVALTNSINYRPAAPTAPPRDIQAMEQEASESVGSLDSPSDVELPDELQGGEDEEEYFGEYMEDDHEGMAEGYADDHDHDDLVESDDLHEPDFDPAALGLKEINNLAHFGVSSHKPGNGVAELLSDDSDKYWQ